jgi:glycosyltransferase involved in cell wall biosynthesis
MTQSGREAERQTPTDGGLRARRLLMIDPARRRLGHADQRFSDLLARAFSDAGYEVVWAVETDDPLPDLPYASIRRLPLAGQAAGASARGGGQGLVARLDHWARTTWKSGSTKLLAKAVALAVWAFVRAFHRVRFAGSYLKWRLQLAAVRTCAPVAQRVCGRLLAIGLLPPAVGADAGQADTPAPRRTELAQLIASLDAEDVLAFPSAEPAQLDMLLRLFPQLDVSSPLPATLHVRFASTACGPRPGHEDAGMLAERLRSGSPVRTVVLHADTDGQCAALARGLGLQVHERNCGDDPAALRRRFAPAPARWAAAPERLDVAPSLVVDRFGPLVLLISALWGRVGSTAIFDAQTRYLLERGFVVARVLIDHYPRKGPERQAHLEAMLAENFERVRPHVHFIAERNEGFWHLARLNSDEVFNHCSPVRRFGMLLADARVDDPAGAAWCSGCAVLSVVNHPPHVAFAERLSRAPVVLETHDIFAKVLARDGLPRFVPRRPDGAHRREADENDIWRRVAACVNLSPDDQSVVSRVATCSVLARPYVSRRDLDIRSWPGVIAANGLPPHYRQTPQFDVMLWGDWHEGNVAGVRWFIEKVADRDARLRQASILVVGRVTRALPGRLLRRPNLFATGFVDRIDDFFARSTVLVIPDRPDASGVSIKMVDALARGCCFASTASGLRGVTLGDTGLAPSDDASALGRDVATLLQSQEARRARAAIARRLYELNFSKAAHARAWDAVVDAVLPGLRPNGAAEPASRLSPPDRAGVRLSSSSTELPAAS